MLTKKSSLILVVGASVALALSGCGGGSSGGGTRPTTDGGVMNPTMTPPATRTQTLLDPVTAANTANAMGRAAEAQPRAGSVTQSSNVDSSNITTDQVDITAEYGSGGPSFSVDNGTAWSIGMSDGNPNRISGTTPPGQGVELRKRITGGTLYVDAYTDIEAPETHQIGGGDDGTQDVPLGTMILSSGVTISAGGNISGYSGTLGGEPGTFNCDGSASGGCGVSNGSTTRGEWTFAPNRPPGAVGVSSSDTVAWTGAFNCNRLPGTAMAIRAIDVATPVVRPPAVNGREDTHGRIGFSFVPPRRP